MSTSARPPVRMGVIGCADIAWRRTLPAMAANPDIDVCGIASRDPAKARAFTQTFGGTPHGGYAALLERDDIDAVYIPLPLMLHGEWVERSLDAGKHVLVEKPMTDSAKESSRLIDAAHARGLVLMENSMFLHHSQHRVVRELIADGAIGDLRGFQADFTIPPKPAGDIRYQADVGGGPFLDFGGYPLRAAMHVLAAPLRVVGAVFRRDLDLDVVMSGSVLLATDEGVPAQLAFGMEHSYANSYSVRGSCGRLAVDWAFTPPHTHRPVIRIDRQDHREERVLEADNQFANVTAVFVDAIHGIRTDVGHEGTLEQAVLMEQIDHAAVNVGI